MLFQDLIGNQALAEEKYPKIFEVLVNKLSQPSIQKDSLVACVDHIFHFLTSLEHFSLCLQWLKQGFIEDLHGNEILKLSQTHKSLILRKVFEEPRFFSLEFKQGLMD
jgi:hypothetical protein